MKKISRNIIICAIALGLPSVLSSCGGKSSADDHSYTKYERNLIKDGMTLYNDSDYNKADVAFEKV